MERKLFERGLQELQTRIVEMGNMVDKALHQAVEALRSRQLALAHHVIENDREINRERFGIEEQALTLIATQSPVAHDLRLIAAVMHMATELERMGDHAKGIARIVELLSREAPVETPPNIELMAEKCSLMLKSTLEAIRQTGTLSPLEIAGMDDELDRLYNETYLGLLNIMTRDPASINPATYMLWVAHNLERFGDRIVNICERIIFVATGEMLEISGSRNG